MKTIRSFAGAVAIASAAAFPVQGASLPPDKGLTYPKPSPNGKTVSLSRSAYGEKLQGFWLGQCVANWTGLRTEAMRRTAPFFTDEDWGTMRGRKEQKIEFVLIEAGEAWGADDDTDIEYIYQSILDDNNVSVATPGQIRNGWLKHIRKEEENFLWVSNERALRLMIGGMAPPTTSLPENNPDYDQIDAQLTTEIFGLFAPTRPDIALRMAHLPIRTTAYREAEWIAEFYVVMHSLASSVDPGLSLWEQTFWLAEQARKRLPDDSIAAKMYEFVKDDYLRNPDKDDWEKTRDALHRRYQVNGADGYRYRRFFDAGINFGSSLVSLFYGEGDFRRTIRIGSLCGWDSDNPTATWGGLLGFMIGRESVEQAFPEKRLSGLYHIGRTRIGFPDRTPDLPGDDTFELMALRGIHVIDRVVLEEMGGSVDLANQVWLIPPGGAVRPAMNERPKQAFARQEVPLLKNQRSPHAKLKGVNLDSVRWTEGFWRRRHDQCREVTLRRLWELAADPDAGHVLDNMRIAGGLAKGEFAGTNWQDAWLYKWIEAAAAFNAVERDPWIEQRMDEAIALIAAAQEDDGYIATQITARGKPRFQDPREHEVYSMGHLLTAACVHHRSTGKDTLLRVAVRCADFLCGTLGVSVSPSYAHNPSAVMGLVDLYRETGDKKYLACAKLIVDRRGKEPKRGGLFYKEPGIEGTDLIQDRTPLRRATQVVGHNVFFTYLYAGAADVYLENGDATLWKPLDRLWRDLTETKMCVNGGVSPMGHGLSLGNDPVVEAVGPSYFLPVADCYNETCGQIGNLMWNHRMLCAKPEARFADLMELELYNGFLAGVGLDGASWFYRNSLRRYDAEHVEHGHNDMAERGLPGRKRICCPTNLLRTFAELPAYLYSTDKQGIWIHHYGGNVFDGRLADGSRLRLLQTTDYPWDGRIVVTVEETEATEPVAVRLRVPGWADGATVAVNGVAPGKAPEAGSYLAIRRAWKAGDTIELNLPMRPRLLEAHPKAEQLRNQIAVMRGPLLYCLESKDLPAGTDLNNILLPEDIRLTPESAADLPFGILGLKGEALRRAESAWRSDLYRPLERSPLKPTPIRMIPYFAWANRGPAAMSVWLPVAWNR